jgi:hypothetical protein
VRGGGGQIIFGEPRVPLGEVGEEFLLVGVVVGGGGGVEGGGGRGGGRGGGV